MSSSWCAKCPGEKYFTVSMLDFRRLSFMKERGKKSNLISSYIVIIETVGIFLVWRSVADTKLLQHTLTFKTQLPVFAFMHGFLRWRVVNKYSLLFSCIHHEDVPDGICSTKRQVTSGALNTLALINQQVLGKEAGVFLLTPNLALRAIYPRCGRSQFVACDCSVRMDATTPRCQRSPWWNICSAPHLGISLWDGLAWGKMLCTVLSGETSSQAALNTVLKQPEFWQVRPDFQHP